MTAPETSASAQTHTPVVTDASRLARVLFSPTAVFEEQKDAPTFWMPFAIMAVLMMVASYFMQPFQQRVRELMLEHLNRPVPPPTTVGMIIGLCTTVIGLLIVCAIGAGILYAITSVFGGDTTYKKLLCVVVFGLPVAFIIQAITVAVLTSRGVASINGPEDMIVSLGLDLLLPQSAQPSYFVRFMLSGIGLLQIWQLTITAMGLAVMAKLSKGSAWTAAIINFVIVLAIMSALGAFGMKMAGGNG